MAQQFDPQVEHTNCNTPRCCGTCDTANRTKDWYLIAINPWYRILYNPKTTQQKREPIQWQKQQNI